MTRKLRAGDRLKRKFNEALERVSKDTGGNLVWDEHESTALDSAADAENRREQLQTRFDRLAADPETSATELAKISGELRGLEKSVAEAIGRLSFDPDAPAAAAGRLSRTRRAAAAQRSTYGGGRRGSA